MLCENCQKKPASLFIKAVTEEKAGEVKLCSKCAKEVGLLEGYSFGDLPFITLLVVGAVTPLLGMDPQNPEEIISIRCPNCGLSFVKFVEINKFGCSECYVVFAEYLDELFMKLQGASRHIEGDLKVLETDGTLLSSRLARLHEKLSEAVKVENYEEAAKLRDKILSLKKAHKRHR